MFYKLTFCITILKLIIRNYEDTGAGVRSNLGLKKCIFFHIFRNVQFGGFFDFLITCYCVR